jgi:hypothetical protein
MENSSMEENHPVQSKPPRRRIGPILWPLILIAFGVLLLLDSLGYLGQSAWSILWNLWPLLFIAIGLDSLLRKKEIFGPVFWIGLGGVILLYNFGIVGWEAWNILFRLWPLLLVTAGLEILLGRRSIWISLPATAIVLAILTVALGLTGVRTPVETTVESSISELLGSAERAKVTIVMAVGDLNVFPLVDANALIAGEISTSSGANVRTSAKMRGDTAVYSIEHSNPVTVPFNDAWQWDLGLTPKVPMELETRMGVGSVGLQLEALSLEEINIGQGVGEIEVILPDGDYRAEVDQAVGQIILEIPEDVLVRLEISRAVSGLSLPSDFEKHGDYYYSPGARGADEFLRIEISQAVGNIIIRYE